MCLDRVDSKEQMKAYLKKKPEKFVVWKAMATEYANYWFFYIFDKGLNIARPRDNKVRARDGKNYTPFFHCFVTYKSAKNWFSFLWPNKFTVHKKDITATGFQDGKRVIVAKKIYL